MEIGMFLLITVAFICGIAVYLRRICNYWSQRGYDGPHSVPLLGNLYEQIIGRKHFGEIFAETYRNYPNATWIGVQKLFNRPAILVRDLELVREILVSSFPHFNQNDFVLDEKLDPLVSVNPFTQGGEQWRTKRAQLVPAFTSTRVRATFPIITNVTKSMLRYVDDLLKLDSDVEVKDICDRFLIDSVAGCAFSIDAESFTNSDAKLRVMGMSMFDTSFGSFIRFQLYAFASEFARLIRLPFLTKDIDQWFRTLVRHLRKKRSDSSNESSQERQNFLQIIHDNLTENDTKKVAENSLVGYSVTFLTDGFETSSILMSFLLYELALNREIQERVLAEIDSVCAESNGELTDEGVHKLTYMEQAMYETLRKYSPVYTVPKVCTEDYELPPQYPGNDGNRFLLRRGMAAIIPVRAIHYDPNIYPEPERFDPDRFSKANKQARHRYSFLAFGEGPRICLGMRFGLYQTKIGIATLLAKYRIRLSARQEVPVQWNPKSFLTTPRYGIWINLEERR